MTTKHKVTAEPADGRSMTLGELAEFVETARAQGAVDTDRPTVRNTVRGHIRRLELDVVAGVRRGL